MEKVIPSERILDKIYYIRGIKVMLDTDLAELYGVETKRLKEQVKRNIKRFPDDFMFELTKEEHDSLRSQFAALESGRGKYSKYLPFAFTEQGVAMLSGVLNSDRAIQANIQIMRAFTQLRKMISSNEALARKIEEMEKKYDEQFRIVFEAIKELLSAQSKPESSSGKIGFKVKGTKGN